jgi:molecular chaperone HtpG
MGQLEQFEGKRFKDAARGDLELGPLESETERHARDTALKESKGLLKRIKDAVGERVTEVRLSTRLKDSPACLVRGEHELGASMRKILAAAGQKVPDSTPALELNAQHPLVKYLDGLTDVGRFEALSLLLYEQAELAEGGELSNPADFVQRLNRLLVELAAGHAA